MHQTTDVSRTTVGRSAILALALASLLTSGCATVSRTIANCFESLAAIEQQYHDLAQIRQDTREELAQQRNDARRDEAQREAESAKYEAERERLEKDVCLANQEALQQQLKRQVQDKIQSKVAFNVSHALEVGELEVDVEALQKVLDQREKEAEQQDNEALRDNDNEALMGPSQKGCACRERECGCRPGLIKKHCLRCCNQPCEGKGGEGGGCGGPEALREALVSPARKPLRPAEIPLKLPVRLAFGMQNPEIEEAKIRREPVTEGGPTPEAQRRPDDQEPQRRGPTQKNGPSQKMTMSDLQGAPSAADANTARRLPPLPTPLPDVERS